MVRLYPIQTHYLIQASFIENILLKTNSFRNFSGNQIYQTLIDAKLLISTTGEVAPLILKDQKTVFAEMLKDWIKKIIIAHTKTEFCEATLKTDLASCLSEHSMSVFDYYILPALQMTEDRTDIEVLGKAWILFGAGLIDLYAPDLPYDPAVHDYVMYDVFSKHKEFVNELSNDLATMRRVTSGDKVILMERQFNHTSPMEAPQKPKIFRPQSSIDSLFDEWSAFLTSTVSSAQAEGLMSSFQKWNNVSNDRHMMFQQNTSHFLNRLETGYRVYSDLNDIFAGYVLSMKFGFDLLRRGKIEHSKTFDISSLWAIDPLEVTNMNNLNKTFGKLSLLLKKTTMTTLSTEEILIYFIELFKIHGKSKCMLDTFNKTLHILYYRWSLRRLKEEQESQEKASIFRFEGSSDDYEKDFKNMFPDYEDALTLDEDEANNSEIQLNELYYKIAVAYMGLFDEDSSENVSSIIHKGSYISEILISETKRFKSQGLKGSQLTAIINRLSQEINSFSTAEKTSTFDFYRDSSVSESQEAIRIIDKLWKYTSELLQQWPEHATLKELFRICQEFLEYPASIPIARQLQKIEQIYTFMTEWQKYASSEVSLAKYIKEITDLIVSWRKLELRTWSGLFASEDEKIKKSVGKWWFYLFETIIIANVAGIDSGKENHQETSLLESLNIFFSKSTFGEFDSRLKLVESFRKHITLIGLSNSNIASALSNITSFYRQFKPIVDDHIARGKKSLEKDLTEVILLASWKDVNVDALKQSSRRSHNNLYKFVRKYRDLLSGTLMTVVESGLSFNPKSSLQLTSIRSLHYRELRLDSAKVIVNDISTWSTRSDVLRNIDRVNENMEIYAEKIKRQEFPDFGELALDFVKEADRLRDETPKVYAKEHKKKLASLRAQKGKMLSDSIKELRRIGLKTSFRKDIHAVQATSTAILANSENFDGTVLEGYDLSFYRILDILPRLRNAIAGPTDDIPVPTLEKGMAVTENLIFSLITTRKPLLTLALNYKKCLELRSDLEEICFTKSELYHSSLISEVDQASYISNWLPFLIDYAKTTLAIIAKPGSVKEDSNFLEVFKSKIVSLHSKISEKKIFDVETKTLLNDFNSLIHQFITKLNEQRDSKSYFVYELILNWLQEQTVSKQEKIEVCHTTIEDFDEKFRKIFTSIVLAFQKIVSDGTLSITDEEDNWLLITSKKIMTNVRLLHSSNITRNIENALNLLKSSNFTTDESRLIRALVTFTMPIINNYYSMMRIVLEKARKYYSQTAHGTYVLSVILHNLAKNGFCSPEPPSEEVDDKNLHEGTGLGDGEGAQNNSKDVDQDEDLTEDAQTANEEQKDKDEREDESEEEDAVDMEGDMAGNVEEISDQEDKEDELDEEEKDELDEEIDDIDEDDPNAIDDKMWDEKPEDDSKEKNSDKDMNQTDDQDVQAAEDEQNDGDNADNGEKESNQEMEEQKDQDVDEDKNADDVENDSEAENEEDVGEQEDEVREEEGQELDTNAPEVETMDLPEDMNLDADEDEENGEDEDDTMNSDLEEQEEEDENEDNTKDLKEEKTIEESDADENDEDQDGEEMEDIDMDMDQSDNKADEPEEEPEVAENNLNDDESPPSEDELADEDQRANKEQGGEETAEGLDGIEEEMNEDDIEAEAAVQQNEGSKGAGSDAKDDKEQEDIGSSGTTQNAHQEEEEKIETNESSREEVKEALKQLGDSMKEYHKRRQEIKEASNNEDTEETSEKANQNTEEFEHVEGANTETDTQALGSATQEQIQSIDEDMAIEEDDANDDNGDELNPKEEQITEDAMDVNNLDEENTEDHEESKGDRNGGIYGGERDENLYEDGDLKTDELLNGREDEDELDELMDEIDRETQMESKLETAPRSLEESRQLWHSSEIATADLVSRLGEQLRLILEPTLATKLKGDYKTGKRLNMKRIIPYIASQFRKDKIWLRRTKPSKRQYQIMIAIDDSKSMSESKCVKLAFDSLCLVSKTLTQLESGGLSIVRFGEHTKEVHPFEQQFSNDSGAKAFQWFSFQDTKTDVKRLVAESIKIFERARSFNNSDQWQLEIIISDGICEDHETIQRLVRRARENKIMLVFVVIDGINSSESIMDMSQVTYVPDSFGNMKLQINKYLDSFPFEFYVVLHDISELPEMLSLILRQYFSDLASA